MHGQWGQALHDADKSIKWSAMQADLSSAQQFQRGFAGISTSRPTRTSNISTSISNCANLQMLRSNKKAMGNVGMCKDRVVPRISLRRGAETAFLSPRVRPFALHLLLYSQSPPLFLARLVSYGSIVSRRRRHHYHHRRDMPWPQVGSPAAGGRWSDRSYPAQRLTRPDLTDHDRRLGLLRESIAITCIYCRVCNSAHDRSRSSLAWMALCIDDDSAYTRRSAQSEYYVLFRVQTQSADRQTLIITANCYYVNTTVP